ncbi:MAG: PhzF family phenazine biosynthesis protein [Pseudomonadota bacterium]|nr:PhzF family phenazine biosynthesis protein [Pseudomonadota bacterium]
MPIPLTWVDAFTDRPFTGNPAAVCVLEHPQPPLWMQQVAQELQVSETAFVHPRADGDWNLRWFTPEVEVELCGHATLATAHALWEHHGVDTTPLVFHTRAGPLRVTREQGLLQLDLPADPPTPVIVDPGIPPLLGTPPQWFGCWRNGYLAVVETAEKVRALQPSMSALLALDADGLLVTAPADRSEFDCISRFFAPKLGIAEDPVTGAAHCALAPFWGQRLGRERLRGHQASLRGGVVEMLWQGDRVQLSGAARTALTGELHV